MKMMGRETERSRERAEAMQRGQGKWGQRQNEAESEVNSRHAEVGYRGDSLSPVSPAWSLQGLDPLIPLLFSGFHRNREGSAEFAYTSTSFLSA